MASFYGNQVANYVAQTRKVVVSTAWTALSVGDTPMQNRYAIRLFIRGNPGQALALTYVNCNADGSFTAPSTETRNCTIYPGGRTWIEPLSARVAVYGRLVKKAAATQNSVPVIITEFS